MWLRVALRWPVAYTSALVSQYRQHDGNTTRARRAAGRQFYDDLKVVRRALSRYRGHDAALVNSRVKAALGLKALKLAGDMHSLQRRLAALRAAVHGIRLAGGLFTPAQRCKLLAAVVGRSEYRLYCRLKSLADAIQPALAGTRYADRIASPNPDPAWEQVLESIAATMRRVIPAQARVATVDKWDPTLLHLSRRRGWHFPDRNTLPDGYPPTSQIAIHHLEELRRRQATYLVLPSAAFWWLDFYTEFRRHLDTYYRRILQDEHCIIFDLS